VRVSGYSGPVAASYRSPSLPEVSEVTYHRSFGFRFWTSSASMLLATLTIGLLVAGGFAALVQPRNHALRRRMASFVTLGLVRPFADAGAKAESLFGGAERRLAERHAWGRLAEALEVAGIKLPALQLVLWTAATTTFVMWLLAVIGGSVIFAPFALVVPFLVRTLVRNKLARQRRIFADQLADNLQVMASAMRAGHSFVGALAAVVDDAAEPSRSEFQRVIREEQLGFPLEESLETVVRRMDNRDLEQVAVVAALQRETGGNTAEVLDRVVDTVRSRAELRRLVRTLTAQGRMSRWVVSALPPALLVIFTLLNPSFTEPLFSEMLGRFLLAVAATLVVIGSLVIKKIVEIEV
jgi:tight adherence protein B